MIEIETVAKAIGHWIARPVWCARCAGPTEVIRIVETYLRFDSEGYRSFEATRRRCYVRCRDCGWLTPRTPARSEPIAVERPGGGAA